MEAEYSRYDRTGQALTFNIINAYYDVLQPEKLIAVNEQSLEQSRQNVDKIKAFVEVGIAIEADVATARVRQASDELAVINNRDNMDLAKANLAVLMGLNPDVSFSVVDEPDYERYIQTGLIETEEISVSDAASQALDHRMELAELRANEAVLEWALTLARLETWPKITADCDYNLWIDDYLRERDALKNHKNWNVSARVTYPIFDGGRSRRTVQRADIAMQRMDESVLEMERSIILEVYQAYLSLERARKSLDITSVQVEDAKMSLDVTQGRYDQQMIILLELLDAQARYAQSLTNKVKAFYDYKVAEGTLQKAMGVL
jgi:outer membrane protein TolC